MSLNAARVREVAADFLFYNVPPAVIAPQLSDALGYRVDAADLDSVPTFDVEDLIVGVTIARKLDGSRERLALNGLLMLKGARDAVIAVKEDWTTMSASELVQWSPDYPTEWANSDSSDDEPVIAEPTPSFNIMAAALSRSRTAAATSR